MAKTQPLACHITKLMYSALMQKTTPKRSKTWRMEQQRAGGRGGEYEKIWVGCTRYALQFFYFFFLFYLHFILSHPQKSISPTWNTQTHPFGHVFVFWHPLPPSRHPLLLNMTNMLNWACSSYSAIPASLIHVENTLIWVCSTCPSYLTQRTCPSYLIWRTCWTWHVLHVMSFLPVWHPNHSPEYWAYFYIWGLSSHLHKWKCY